MIRVLRVIEYEYPDAETQLADMDRWTANYKTKNMTMRSAVVSVSFEKEEG